MAPPAPRTVDRSFARLVALKRIATGSMSLAAAVIFVGLALARQAPVTPMLGLALVIFVGGGIWTLRDGLRLRRELAMPAVGSSPRPSVEPSSERADEGAAELP